MANIIIIGNLSDGFRFVGPFADFDDADEASRDVTTAMETSWIAEIETPPAKPTETETRALALLRSLRADIEAMRLRGRPNWFGEFEYEQAGDMAEIEWPNLAALSDKIDALLKDQGE